MLKDDVLVVNSSKVTEDASQLSDILIPFSSSVLERRAGALDRPGLSHPGRPPHHEVFL